MERGAGVGARTGVQAVRKPGSRARTGDVRTDRIGRTDRFLLSGAMDTSRPNLPFRGLTLNN